MKVHVVTVNDYLVQRDRDWTAPFFRALGLTVGAIHPQHMQDEDQKRVMYRCDVVYGTTAEFGFDYLRDNMKRSRRRAGAEAAPVRHRGRGRLDPDRRGPYAAHHLRAQRTRTSRATTLRIAWHDTWCRSRSPGRRPTSMCRSA
jgi:hypothetical protein